MAKELNPMQASMLFVVDNNEPVSVADVAGHMLLDEGSARSRLATLERHGLIARQYTGHHRGSGFAYTITSAGSEALEASDHLTEEEVEEGVCDLCGRSDGRHMRACIRNPDRPCRTP